MLVPLSWAWISWHPNTMTKKSNTFTEDFSHAENLKSLEKCQLDKPQNHKFPSGLNEKKSHFRKQNKDPRIHTVLHCAGQEGSCCLGNDFFL